MLQRGSEGRIYRSAGLTAEILRRDLHPLCLYKRRERCFNPLVCTQNPPRLLCSRPTFKLRGKKITQRAVLLTSVSHQEGNTFAQCTRQLILTMSSALGRRMKQRFDLIGCEKVSRLGPAGEKGGVQRAGGWNEGWLEGGWCWKRRAQDKDECKELLIYLSDSCHFPRMRKHLWGVRNKHTLIPHLIKRGTNTSG